MAKPKKPEAPKPEEKSVEPAPQESAPASSSLSADYEQHPKFAKFKKPQGEN